MESITFKKEGFWYIVYTLLYGKLNLPEDTCSYRKGLIFSVLLAIVIFPITLLRLSYRGIMYLVNKYKDWGWDDADGYKGYLIWGAILILPILFGKLFTIGEPSFNLPLYYHWILGISAVLGIVIFFLICFGVGEGFKWIYETIRLKYMDWRYADRDVNEDVEKPKTMITELYESWKDKYCKKIDWK